MKFVVVVLAITFLLVGAGCNKDDIKVIKLPQCQNEETDPSLPCGNCHEGKFL